MRLVASYSRSCAMWNVPSHATFFVATFPALYASNAYGNALNLAAVQGPAKDSAPIRGSGRNFDFYYGSGVKTHPLTKIKGATATDVSLLGAQRHRSDACKPLQEIGFHLTVTKIKISPGTPTRVTPKSRAVRHCPIVVYTASGRPVCVASRTAAESDQYRQLPDQRGSPTQCAWQVQE